jgi:RNA polymerase sigma factor (TIGR02999 family)
MSQAAPDSPPDRGGITDLLLRLRGGDPEAEARLYEQIYADLRGLAHAQLRRERPGHTLGTTGLVHETYLRLVDQTRVEWRDRGHFFGAASLAMRRILVDYARRSLTARRGGKVDHVPLSEDAPAAARGDALLALDEALDRLAELDRRLSEVVVCRYFGGLTAEETAEALGITERTVQRDWVKARGWLYQELNG